MGWRLCQGIDKCRAVLNTYDRCYTFGEISDFRTQQIAQESGKKKQYNFYDKRQQSKIHDQGSEYAPGFPGWNGVCYRGGRIVFTPDHDGSKAGLKPFNQVSV